MTNRIGKMRARGWLCCHRGAVFVRAPSTYARVAQDICLQTVTRVPILARPPNQDKILKHCVQVSLQVCQSSVSTKLLQEKRRQKA